MRSVTVENITVQFDRDGRSDFRRSGAVNWFGKPVIVQFRAHEFHFDLEGRIQRIDGFSANHVWDWIQRTMANDWLYYDGNSYSGDTPPPEPLIGDAVWAVNGRTDLPMLQGHGGLQRDYVAKALAHFDDLIRTIRELVERRPGVELDDPNRLWCFLEKAAKNDRAQLQRIAEEIHGIHGGMAVLPPDTIAVDYRVILLKVMEGCVNACRFCTARGSLAFAMKSRDDIDRQIAMLAAIYGEDRLNYNSVVLGECDALLSPELEYAATQAYEAFACGASCLTGANLFLFATNKTFLAQSEAALDRLEALPFDRIAINIGWEAGSDKVLRHLGKPQTARGVLAGMERAGVINRTRKKVQVSGNFLLTDQYECDDIAIAIRASQYCGPLYLSPLRGQCSARHALRDLAALKQVRPEVCVRLYTMQRL